MLLHSRSVRNKQPIKSHETLLFILFRVSVLGRHFVPSSFLIDSFLMLASLSQITTTFPNNEHNLILTASFYSQQKVKKRSWTSITFNFSSWKWFDNKSTYLGTNNYFLIGNVDRKASKRTNYTSLYSHYNILVTFQKKKLLVTSRTHEETRHSKRVEWGN